MAENVKPVKKGGFNLENALRVAIKMPGVKIDRTAFLKKELNKLCDDSVVEKAIETNPAQAGISKKIISNMAKSSITFETTKVSLLSAASGIPGGFAMAATIPADMVQYLAHILRILQKLAYLYGWQEFSFDDDDQSVLDEETMNQLILFIGVMFGVDAAKAAVVKIANALAANIPKALMKKALTKGVIFPIVKKIAALLGIKMTKEVFAKGVGKIIPVIGAVVSGGVTLAGFVPMARHLRDYLAGLPLADPETYKNRKDEGEVVDLDFSDISTEEIDAEISELSDEEENKAVKNDT